MPSVPWSLNEHGGTVIIVHMGSLVQSKAELFCGAPGILPISFKFSSSTKSSSELCPKSPRLQTLKVSGLQLGKTCPGLGIAIFSFHSGSSPQPLKLVLSP